LTTLQELFETRDSKMDGRLMEPVEVLAYPSGSREPQLLNNLKWGSTLKEVQAQIQTMDGTEDAILYSGGGMIRCSYTSKRLIDIVVESKGSSQGGPIPIRYTGKTYGLETVANEGQHPKEVLHWEGEIGSFVLKRVAGGGQEDIYLCQEKESADYPVDLLLVDSVDYGDEEVNVTVTKYLCNEPEDENISLPPPNPSKNFRMEGVLRFKGKKGPDPVTFEEAGNTVNKIYL